MKINMPHAAHFLVFSFVICWPAQTILHAKEVSGSYLSDAVEPKPEPPKTTSEKLQGLQKSYEDAFASLSSILNKLPEEPEQLGSKGLFDQVDQSDREFKRIRSACSAVMSTLRSDAKTIKASSYFTEEQKQELTASAESLAKECADLSTMLDVAVQRLASAYSVLPRWKTIYRSYHNLQGEAKAAEQIKAQIEAYLHSFNAEQEVTSQSEAPTVISDDQPD